MKKFRPALARALLSMALAACAAPKPPPSEAPFQDDSAVLIPTNRLATPPFAVRQRVRGRHISQDVSFECDVQLSQGKLSVIGLTPYTTRAFELEQDGIQVRSQAFMLRDVWFEPEQVLYDIHRVFFRGLTGPQRDGMHELLDHGELVREWWQGGHVIERRFHSLDTNACLVVISFKGAPAPVIAPHVRITNLHYSYALVIENVQQRRLDEGYSLGLEREHAR